MIWQSRLRFFFRVNAGLPPTFVDRFTAGRSFEAAFAPRARRYRPNTRIVIVLLLGFALGLVGAVTLPVPEAARGWIALPSATLLPLAVLIHFASAAAPSAGCSSTSGASGPFN